jgi:hypothetical protein
MDSSDGQIVVASLDGGGEKQLTITGNQTGHWFEKTAMGK